MSTAASEQSAHGQDLPVDDDAVILAHGRRVLAREREALVQAQDNIGASFAEAVRLRVFEELPMQDVADRLGVSLSTAKRRFLSGAKLYRERLEVGLGSRTAKRRTGP